MGSNVYDPFESSHDQVAEKYDDLVHRNLAHDIRENYFGILDRVVALLCLSPGARVLDVGIGTGLLAERMPDGIELHGIDVYSKMLDQIKIKGLPAIVQVGHFLDIPYGSDSFDVIVSTFALHHVPQPYHMAAFKELDRVLRPKGVLLVADFMTENRVQRAELVERFELEKRTDMLLEMDEEHFMDIESATRHFEGISFCIAYERVSTLSWIFRAMRKKPESKG
jgi:putative AdoMet-dependent methyltransferase